MITGKKNRFADEKNSPCRDCHTHSGAPGFDTSYRRFSQDFSLVIPDRYWNDTFNLVPGWLSTSLVPQRNISRNERS